MVWIPKVITVSLMVRSRCLGRQPSELHLGRNFLSRSTYSVPDRLCDFVMSLASHCLSLAT